MFGELHIRDEREYGIFYVDYHFPKKYAEKLYLFFEVMYRCGLYIEIKFWLGKFRFKKWFTIIRDKRPLPKFRIKRVWGVK